MTPKEFQQMWEDDLLEWQHEELDDSWRHGNRVTTVFKSPDGRLWRAKYNVSGDGEFNGMREGEFSFEEVESYTEVVTLTKYRPKKY